MTRTRTASRHSCETPEWYTPAHFVDAAREVLGGITLDPASSREANRIVRALRIYTEANDGLSRPWSGQVFVNPPGGLTAKFWAHLIGEWEAGRVEAAIWIGYSLEQLQTLQGVSSKSPLDFSICIPDRRIAFVENEARRLERLRKIDEENEGRRREGLELLPRKLKAASPSHGNYVTYIGRAPARFARVFSTFGEVRS